MCKVIVACLFSLCCGAVVLCAAEKVDQNIFIYSGAYLDGSYWNALSPKEKDIFLYGVGDGVSMYLDKRMSFGDSKKDKELVRKCFVRTSVRLAPELSRKEIITQLDQLYGDPVNTKITISQLYAFICQEQFTKWLKKPFDRAAELKEIQQYYNAKKG